MPSLEEMRALGQEIVASKRSRKEAVASLKDETHALMNELAEGSKARQMGVRIQLTGSHKDHQAMGKEVRAELAEARSQLKSDSAALMADLAKTTKARKQDVRSQLRGYGTEMKGVRAEFVAARTGWQEGLGAAPSRPKPTPSAPPKARSKSRRPPSR